MRSYGLNVSGRMKINLPDCSGKYHDPVCQRISRIRPACWLVSRRNPPRSIETVHRRRRLGNPCLHSNFVDDMIALPPKQRSAVCVLVVDL